MPSACNYRKLPYAISSLYENERCDGKIEGKIEASREMLINMANEQYGVLPPMLEMKIKSIQSDAALKYLARKVVKMNNLSDFQDLVNQATDN